MSENLLAGLSSLLTPELIGKAASMLGDSEPAVSKGMSAVFPVLLGSLANRSSDSAFASTMFNLVRDPANDGSLLGNVASLLSPGAASSPMMALGGKLLSALFGNNLGSLGGSLAGYSGVKPSSASSMLSFAAPLVLSMLGKAVKSGNLNVGSLVSLLTGQKSTSPPPCRGRCRASTASLRPRPHRAMRRLRRRRPRSPRSGVGCCRC